MLPKLNGNNKASAFNGIYLNEFDLRITFFLVKKNSDLISQCLKYKMFMHVNTIYQKIFTDILI